ncbi:hypothetical protein [Brachybacterium sacelli]|uniref:Uncharacterized protein n=1 Tax=Brachybacterium sacelli TaxID=173364 RepID=A0ABS4WXG8_9MICO|nr:hypothetical protein [Brachybacterium sacelli]MBP2380199.1 hypothetical protein [Brachybacterium sacelli]
MTTTEARTGMTLTAAFDPEATVRLRDRHASGPRTGHLRALLGARRHGGASAVRPAGAERSRPVFTETSWDSVDPLAYDTGAGADLATCPGAPRATDEDDRTSILELDDDAAEDHWAIPLEMDETFDDEGSAGIS